MVYQRLIFVALLIVGSGVRSLADPPALAGDEICVGVSDATADKPQSKLWFAKNTWWAWLPTSAGSSIWRRESCGWQRQTDLDEPLHNLPGRADVWSEGDNVRAVLVSGNRLAVVDLLYNCRPDKYELTGEPAQFTLCGPDKAVIGSATIARDGSGRWWIAYSWQRQMWVRWTIDNCGREWSEPFAVSNEALEEDLCAIVAMPGEVGLIWSDQSRDALFYCEHDNSACGTKWGPIEAIDHGGQTADNHVSAKCGADGRLYVATKNSVDKTGQPQLVLRVRESDGCWQSYDYALRTSEGTPSRPIVLIEGARRELLLLHTVYRRDAEMRRRNIIACLAVPMSQISETTLKREATILIDPETSINNVTGCKADLPANQPWIALAADQTGRVYEILIPAESNRSECDD